MSYLDTLKTLKFKISKVTVEGTDFYLLELSGKARLDFEGEKDLQLRVLKIMHASLCDADRNLTERPEDFDAFMESVPNKALLQLVNAFSALNITGEPHLKKLIRGSCIQSGGENCPGASSPDLRGSGISCHRVKLLAVAYQKEYYGARGTFA
ncbi:hypothetical protein [Succinimonas sp.]|uniref:hypothetical protein n=1 Tax=Succinimonas sp. TaxID=1936151 RepID=UPI0038707927